MAAISACIDSWNWEDLLVSGAVPASSPVPSTGNQTLPSLAPTESPPLSFSFDPSAPPNPAAFRTATLVRPRSLGCSVDGSRVISPRFAGALAQQPRSTTIEISRGANGRLSTRRETDLPLPAARSFLPGSVLPPDTPPNAERNYDSPPCLPSFGGLLSSK